MVPAVVPAAGPAVATSRIKIESPAKDTVFEDETFIRSTIKVTKDAPINRVYVRVLNKGKPVLQQQDTFQVEKDSDGSYKTIKATVRIGRETNEITAFNPDPGAASTDSHTVIINCTVRL